MILNTKPQPLINIQSRNMFDFKNIFPFERQMADDPGAMVLFATPGMLHAGTSLEVFKKWAGSEKNMVLMPGYVISRNVITRFILIFAIFRYCVVGTVGNRLLAGKNRNNVPLTTFFCL